MTDEIPPQLYLLDELVEFNIFDNALEGTLPSQIGNWTRLQVFDVEGNNLTGDPWTPLLFRWTDLTVIRLSNNAWNVPDQKFNDHITDWVTLGSVGSLRVLDVANAGWQGSVPEEIGNFSSLGTCALLGLHCACCCYIIKRHFVLTNWLDLVQQWN